MDFGTQSAAGLPHGPGSYAAYEEVACALGVRITELKHAVQHILPLKGKSPLAQNRVTKGKMHFEGRAVNKAYIDN